MFSLQKIAVLIGIISAVWAAFRFIGQMQKAQQERAKLAQKEAKQQKREKANAGTAKAVELAACKKCGAFVPNGIHEC